MTKLFFVTGASGTGKSSIVSLLQKQLGVKYAVYDFDEIWKPYDFTDTWAEKVTKRALDIATENEEKGISMVVAGLVRPLLVKKLAEGIRLPEIHFCLLDINIEERKKRLEDRKASKELISDIEELLGLRDWVKKSGYKYVTVDTTNLSPKEVVEKVTSWIRKINSQPQN